MNGVGRDDMVYVRWKNLEGSTTSQPLSWRLKTQALNPYLGVFLTIVDDVSRMLLGGREKVKKMDSYDRWQSPAHMLEK